jgi:hypothetical protein
MDECRLEFLSARHADHVRELWTLAGRTDLEQAVCGGRYGTVARLTGRHHLAERRLVGTGRRLLSFRLPVHRHSLDPSRQPGSLEPKSRGTRWMVGERPGEFAGRQLTLINKAS